MNYKIKMKLIKFNHFYGLHHNLNRIINLKLVNLLNKKKDIHIIIGIEYIIIYK